MSKRKETLDLGDLRSSAKRLDSAQSKPEINPYTGQMFSQKYYQILEKRKTLPVYQFQSEFEGFYSTINDENFINFEFFILFD